MALSLFFLLFYFQIAHSSSDDITRLTNNNGVAEMISQCKSSNGSYGMTQVVLFSCFSGRLDIIIS